MKKLVFLLCLVFISNVSFGVNIIIRHNKGLFGYRHVDQHDSEVTGDKQLNCTNPGFRKCKWQSGLADLNDEYGVLLEKVDDLIEVNRQFSGSFEADGYFVQYKFILTDDYLEVKIYTREEAIKNGLI